MRRKTELPELLAPAGSFECLVAAIAAGADAVYVGGRRFGARAYAKNFDIDELGRAVRYCHLWGVKLYVTVNTLIEDRELGEVFDYASELCEIGVDALIVADLGVVTLLREAYPELEIHASTQMSVHSTEGAIAAYGLGCSRVVPARELSYNNIKSIVDNSPTEVEIFLHGALCVCHSGQCLYSSLVGGRSGNRGECAQPCRLPYGDGYPLSLKDLSLAEHIPEIIELGVSSLKIEGRMKSAQYVYNVTRVYRKLLDEGRAASAEELSILRRAFSRGGFTDGYFIGKTEEGMLGIRSEEDKEESRVLSEAFEGGAFTPKRRRVMAEVSLRIGEAARLTLIDEDRSVSVSGPVPERAIGRAISEEELKERIAKVGDSFLSLEAADVKVEIDDGVFMPISAINALRRAACDAFELCGVKVIPRVEKTWDLPPKFKCERLTSAQFMSESSYTQAREVDSLLVDRIDIKILPLFASDSTLKTADAVYLPPVVTDLEMPRIKNRLREVSRLKIRRVMAGNIGQIGMLKDMGFSVIGDFRLNVTNRVSAEACRKIGVNELILSPELTVPKARDIGGGVISYGRIPLMLTERCFIGENFGCASCGSTALVDRRGESFPMMREWEHRNLILNSAVTYMGDKRAELDSAGLYHSHLIFTVEDGEEILDALRAYFGAKPLPESFGTVRRAGRRDVDVRTERIDTRQSKQKPTQAKAVSQSNKNTVAHVSKSGSRKGMPNKRSDYTHQKGKRH